MAHGLHQLAQFALHLGRVGHIKANQARDQTGERADDADARQDAGDVGKKMGLEWRIHQGLVGEKVFCVAAGLPLPSTGL